MGFWNLFSGNQPSAQTVAEEWAAHNRQVDEQRRSEFSSYMEQTFPGISPVCTPSRKNLTGANQTSLSGYVDYRDYSTPDYTPIAAPAQPVFEDVLNAVLGGSGDDDAVHSFVFEQRVKVYG